MPRHSPTRDGFRAMFQRPSVGIAEVLWRWSFGACFCLLLLLCFAQYLRSLPVSKAQMFLIGSGQVMLAVKALQQILAGSSIRLIRAFFVLAVSAATGWVILASIGRAVTLRGLLSERNLSLEDTSLHSMLGLTILRATAFIGVCVLSLGVFVVLANSQLSDSSAGAAVVLCLALLAIVWIVWSVGNWFFSVAAIFVAKDGCRTFPAIGRVASLCANRAGAVFVVGFWFGLARVAAIYIASMFCILFVGITPFGSSLMLAAIIASSLAYVLLADFLYIGRLAAYLSMADWPLGSLAAQAAGPLDLGTVDSSGTSQAAAVDRDELILSDFSVGNTPQPSE
jgi:hypothetical protein